MQLSAMNRRLFLYVLGSCGGGAVLFATGCGSSNPTEEITPDAKKALMARRGFSEKSSTKTSKSKKP